MKITNVVTDTVPGPVLADLHFDVGEGLDRPASRVDQYFDAFLDCLYRLDRDGVYTFLDPKSQGYVRVERMGEEVHVQSEGARWLPDGLDRMAYEEFRSGILRALHLYRDQLLAGVGPTHPETGSFLARLEAVETS